MVNPVVVEGNITRSVIIHKWFVLLSANGRARSSEDEHVILEI